MEGRGLSSPLDILKSVYSSALLLFSVVLVIGLIFTQNTKFSQDVHPAVAFVVLCVSLVWLNMVEGGQASMVGLPPINRNLYESSHRISSQICAVAHKGDNLDRYLIGRQFMVLAIVFAIHLSASPLEPAIVYGLPAWLLHLFLGSGLGLILMTTMIGQLNSQVNSSRCMLDYINNYSGLLTLYIALAIEFSGLLHSVYLIQMFVCCLAGKPMESNEPPKNGLTLVFYWFRILYSVAILGFSFAVTLTALFTEKTSAWIHLPNYLSLILFFVIIVVVGILEGMLIAFYAVAKLPKEEQAKAPWAMKTSNLLFEGEEGKNNLPGFVVGRQIMVTTCFFIVARLTTLNVDTTDDDTMNVFGVSDGWQRLFNTGVLGAIIITTVASISWQLIASAFPLTFLSFPLVYIFLRVCLFLEATGICNGAWVLAALHKKVTKFQFDEVYVGTAEDRARSKIGDEEMSVKSGHLYPGVPALPARMEGGVMTAAEIANMQVELAKHQQEVADRIKELEVIRKNILAKESAVGDDDEEMQV